MEGKSIVAVFGHPLIYDNTLYLIIVVISENIFFWGAQAHLNLISATYIIIKTYNIELL